jgi:predicted transcriptional regulator YdeE
VKISNTPRLIVLAMVLIAILSCNKSQQTTPDIKRAGQMKYSIVERNAFTIIGTLTRVTPAQENADTYGGIWHQFESYNANMKPLSIDRRYYGVSFATKQEGVTDYLAGMMVADDAKPFDKQLKVPAARYAVFQCPIQDIGQTYQYIFSQWLSKSRYEFNPAAHSFEQYAPQGQDDSSVLIHIPIREK